MPVMYLILDPALLLLSLYYAFVFGVLYLVIVTVRPTLARCDLADLSVSPCLWRGL
jgi:hypothetical protein